VFETDPTNNHMFWRLIIIPLLLVNLLYACTGHYTRTVKTKGIYYRVKSGDTLWSIANAYNIDIQELAEANNITDPKLIGADTVLFIPDADQIIDDVMSAVGEMESAKKIAKKEGKTSEPKTRKRERPGDKVQATPEMLSMRDASRGKEGLTAGEESKGVMAKSAEEGTALTDRVSPREETGRKVEQKGRERDGGGESAGIKFDKERFIWPVKGKVRSRFGFQRDGTYNNWITIAAKEGAPVLSAASGTVIFSNSLKDYGETIIIKHQDNFATVYTGLSGRIAQVDDKIRKGGRIAFLGKTEKKGEASLRFEIRHKNKARNPLFFLP
jgi:lipoprotein NlpD